MSGVLSEAIAVTKDEKGMAAFDAHLRQWQDIAERFRTQLSPALKAHETLEKLLEPIVAQQERWRQQLVSILIPRFDLPDLSRFAMQAADFQSSIQESISLIFEPLQKSFRDLSPRTQEALLLLGEHGWYLDLEMPVPALWELREAFSAGSVRDAEDVLAEYFEGRTAEIEESLTKRFPHREQLIRAAFSAHRRQEYELSIPVLFAQTDGICKEVAGQYLFVKRDGKPQTAIYVEQIASDTFTAALLSPLAEVLPISASEHQRPAGFSALNRHMVMHGESMDYTTKTNSLKAISLVNYVGHILTFEKEIP